MSQINMVGNIKDLFPNYMVLVRVGTFYDASTSMMQKY